MSIRNNACFSKLTTGLVCICLAVPNLVWANQNNYFQKNGNGKGHSNIDNHNHSHHKDSTKVGEFGVDIDLSTFNELDAVVTDDNYAEVVLENSILGDVYIEQASRYSGNKAKVVQSNSKRSEANIWQYGGDNTALITQEGVQNKAYIAQYGYGNDALINQSGNYNTAAIIQYGYGSSLSINQTGNNNQAYIVDYGGSNYGISQNGNDFVAIIGGRGMNINVIQN